ncbi:transposase [Candidatus Falkowbacteria bacterium]|nr:transposase [Candidatus Falkowbacteria bacterium]
MRSLPIKNCGISQFIQQFKSAVTRIINKHRHISFQWQKSYFDRVLRDDDELEHARWYIQNNPRNWRRDRNNI